LIRPIIKKAHPPAVCGPTRGRGDRKKALIRCNSNHRGLPARKELEFNEMEPAMIDSKQL
ncbi:MAG TPA: hypothetical protein PKJ13_11755, partial [bacterium]|nr:hypothetical protein [bacterium]